MADLVTARETQGVRFGFYTDAELRRLSVTRIHSSEQRDALNRPLPGGLYDPAMGPTDQYESCITCGLDYAACPGHLGRIELTKPVYVPALFPTLVQLLRGTCLRCGHFRGDAQKLKAYGTALDLIDAGLLVDAAKVWCWPASLYHDATPISKGPHTSLLYAMCLQWLGAAPGSPSELRSEESLRAWMDDNLSNFAQRLLTKVDIRLCTSFPTHARFVSPRFQAFAFRSHLSTTMQPSGFHSRTVIFTHALSTVLVSGYLLSFRMLCTSVSHSSLGRILSRCPLIT
jgi:hypothetical protein